MGPSRSTATCHAWAVSLASAGRIKQSPGIARSAGKVLHRLMRGAVLAEAHRVVGPGVDDVRAGDGRQAHGGPHVVAEHEERAPTGMMPPWSAMPVMVEPMPCSRTPKWI